MLSQPGFATRLRNFEVDPDGGYRRVDGFTQFGDTNPNSSETILGMTVYADGVVVCSGTGIFFSQDGETTWLQINRASVASSGDNYTAFTGRSLDARTSQGQVTFALFEGNTDYGQLVITDGANKPFLFSKRSERIANVCVFNCVSISLFILVLVSIGCVLISSFCKYSKANEDSLRSLIFVTSFN